MATAWAKINWHSLIDQPIAYLLSFCGNTGSIFCACQIYFYQHMPHLPPSGDGGKVGNLPRHLQNSGKNFPANIVNSWILIFDAHIFRQKSPPPKKNKLTEHLCLCYQHSGYVYFLTVKSVTVGFPKYAPCIQGGPKIVLLLSLP